MTHFVPFPNIGLAEAKDISIHLNPIQKHFTQLEETDFAEAKPLLQPLLHVVCLVWSRSRYYCQSSKLTVLLRQICNLLIHQAKRFLDPSSIFHTDIDEAMQRLTLCMQTLRQFRAQFDDYKENLDPFFLPHSRSPLYWTFHPNAVFARFNAFLERLHTIQWFFCTVIEFLKLEKVEIGGLKGRQLSSKITAIYVDFNQHFASFASKTYDVLDPDDSTFDQDFAIFQERILELDMKLAAILCQAFDDCHNLESVFKLVSIVGSVLDRPKIKEEFTNKYGEVLQMLEREMECCEAIYAAQMKCRRENGENTFANRSMPTVSAALRWCKQLATRITAPIKSFKTLQHAITKCEMAQRLYERYDTLMEALGMLEHTMFNEWTCEVAGQIDVNLQKSLIERQGGSNLLMLNFSAELFVILREVHYLSLMGKDGVPAEGIAFAQKNDMFRNFTVNLEKTIDWYNGVSDQGLLMLQCFSVISSFRQQIVRHSTDVELKLIKTEIEEIDQSVLIGINELSWNSESKIAANCNQISHSFSIHFRSQISWTI